ncbi:MAG: N-acetylmuramoyl-L-alanine amidase [Bacteroidetes bacterium]|nr:N-acetylmuramoyl-L-alanine amidase [Bacteroidota bacterium]
MRIKKKLVFLLLIVFLSLTNFSEGTETPQVKIVHPSAGTVLNTQNGFCYVLGTVTPSNAKLFINGDEAQIEQDGAFIHYTRVIYESQDLIIQLPDSSTLPVNAYLDFKLIANGVTDEFKHYVKTNLPLVTSSPEILQVDVSFSNQPNVNQKLLPGEVIDLKIKATPGCNAAFSISGVKEQFPMVETFITNEFYLGEAIFGSGFVQSSDTVKGIYEGHFILPNENWKERRLTVHFSHEKLGKLDYALPGTITINQSLQYDIVELLDEPNLVVGRTAQGLGYKLFLPGGIKAICDGEIQDWLRLRLAKNEIVFVPRSSVKFLPAGSSIPKSSIEVVRTKNEEDHVRVEIGLRERLPFEIKQLSNPLRLSVKIFRAVSDIDWIFYDRSQSLVENIEWSQTSEDILELSIDLNQKLLWGYSFEYEGNILILKIKKSPQISKKWLFFGNPLEGRKIVLDPGHNPDFGSVGPRNVKEKDVNLQITLKVKELLEKEGAKVFLTHSGEGISLRQRKQKVLSFNPDVSISIHNNALPEGVNPFEHNGSSVYFYNANAKLLAESIHKNLLQQLKLKDFGLYWDNLYMCRIPETVAILIEPAFMIIPQQEKLLSSDEFQYKIAEAVKNGLEEFFQRVAE